MKNFNDKRIMILGGGINQYPFVKAAHDIGLYTILCDRDEKNISIELADKYYPVSILDKEAVLAIAVDEEIDGIISSSELGMHAVSYVAGKLHLPTISYDSFLTLVNKARMKQFLEENGFNYPKYLLGDINYNLETMTDLVKRWDCRLIIKPIDSSGSRGVSLIDDLSDLEQAISVALSHSKAKQFIIEEYIEQKYDFMVGGDIFVFNNNVVFGGIMDSMRNMSINSYVPTGTSYPSSISKDERQRVMAAIERVVDLLGIEFGSFNIEIMFDQANRLYINEINPRNGGNSIPALLLEATGFDFFKNTCLGACRMLNLESDTRFGLEKYCATHVIHCQKDGVGTVKDFSFVLPGNVWGAAPRGAAPRTRRDFRLFLVGLLLFMCNLKFSHLVSQTKINVRSNNCGVPY